MEIRSDWITLPDGVRLSADLYRPTGGKAGEKFPVLLEYLPYRKHEARGRNWPLYSYFVQRGYVVAAVDIRGTGNSEGRLIPYEYSEIEQEDGEVVIDWLSKQAWSNGNVGMFGISWGGFNSIQMAARNPPALKAIIAIDATEDLFQDDVHYMDGIMHLDSWEMSMDLDNTRPGAPEYRIDDDNFRNRFDTEPWMLTYKTQQRDGAVLGPRLGARPLRRHPRPGFPDRRLVRRLPRQHPAHARAREERAGQGDHRRLGPHLAERAVPEARHGMAPRGRALVRSLAQGRGHRHPRGAASSPCTCATGIRPARISSSRRATGATRTAGRSRATENRVLYPQPNHTLAAEAPAATTHELRYIPSVGFEAGGPVMWWGDVAHDQRGTDAFSLVYDSEPLDRRASRSWACRMRRSRSRRMRRAPTGSRASRTSRPTAR